MQKKYFYLVLGLLLSSQLVMAQGNMTNQSFSKAKKYLQTQVYTNPSDMRTIYCGAVFNSRKYLVLLQGFVSLKYKNRLKHWEAEHVVPAENFGRTFKEWRDGDPSCVNSKGHAFKGRRCAEKVNAEYRYMQADMYNLWPAIGAVNAARQNYNFQTLPSVRSNFGSCDFRIENRKVQPPERARGIIARTYEYMELAYPRYKISRSQRQLMAAWDRKYPVSEFECKRADIIENIQGNINIILQNRCQQLNKN